MPLTALAKIKKHAMHKQKKYRTANLRRPKSCAKLLVMLTSCLLTGCANFLFGESAMRRNPIENPTINVTNFTRSLECMDNLLIQHDAPRITITAQDVPNMTGDGSSIAGTKDMLITSISKLSQRSRRIRFVSYGTDLRDIILLHKAHEGRDNFVTPDYFIRGAITQLDKNVMSSRIGAAANADNWNTAFSGGQGVSFVGLDLNIGLVSSLQMIPGVTSNNVLALWDRGAGTDLGGRINSVGTFFDFGIDRRDGLGQAIRNMTDLAVIEIIGKLLDLPYLTCLPLNHHSAAVQSLIHSEYQRYSQNPRKLIRTVQAKLKHFNYYQGPVHGVMDRSTSLALEYFRNLYQPNRYNSGTGALDFDLYYQIMYGQRYAWHFDRLPYPRPGASQQRVAMQPHMRTQHAIPEALRYNSAHEAQRLEEYYQPNGRPYQPIQRPHHQQPHYEQPPRHEPSAPQEYSPPRVAIESTHQPHLKSSPIPIPQSYSRPRSMPSRHSTTTEPLPTPYTKDRSQNAPATHMPPDMGIAQHPGQHQSQRQYQRQGMETDNLLAAPSDFPPYGNQSREAAFGLPAQRLPKQKTWPLQEQRYPYERGDSWDQSITQDIQLYEHYHP